MNEFTAEELRRYSQLVKWATTTGAVQSLMGPGSYARWLQPQVEDNPLKPAVPERPGFLASVGRSALGSLDRLGGSQLRSFVGLSPGPSGARSLMSNLPSFAKSWWNDDQAGYEAAALRGAVGLARSNDWARWQSQPYANALSNWWETEKQDPRNPLMMARKSLMDWYNATPSVPAPAPSAPRSAPWMAPSAANTAAMPLPKPTI